jgi:hypothetical protein
MKGRMSKIALVLLLTAPPTSVLFGVFLTGHGADSVPLRQVSTIRLPGVRGRFDHFAVDPAGSRLFVAALGHNTLEILDLAGAKRVQSVVGMSKPTGVLYLSELHQVLVANGENGALKVLDGVDFKMKHSLGELPDADNLRFDPKTKLAWLGYGDGAFAIIEPAGPRVVGRIKLPAHPESFQLETNGTRVFVNLPDAKQIAVVDRDKRALIASWSMEKFQANFPMALDEPNHRLFVGCRKPARLVVLDTETGRPVADLAIFGDTDDLFYDAKRKRLYISCGEGSIDSIEQESADSYKPLAKVYTSPGARTCFFSPDLDRLYLAVPDRGNQKAEIRVYLPE